MFVAFSRSLFWKLFLPIGGLLIVCGIAAAIFLPILRRSNAEAEAVSVGLDTLTQFKTLRGYYTENVVSKLLAKGDIKPGAEHKGNPDRGPLPATMILDLSDLLQKEGTTLKLYSPYPFPNRKGRVLDDFGQAAWDYLHHHPDQTFSRTEVVNGKPIDTLRLIRDDASSVSAASAEIATSNSEFSARAEQQASSLEETASSMEELTSTVKANADHVNQANRLAVSAHDIATNGGEIMQQVIGTMASINESTKKIADITSVIDGIAFQTNILALNAAVEAARAGEQGRGFAVVAAEVRTLAQRSAAAAREIKAIADESVEKVEQGEKLAAQSGETMHGIVDGIRQVTDLMNDIATASGEQSSGIEQVGQAVMLIDDATQKNAALVEEIAAAAEALQQKANNLEQAVQRFNLP